jgi:hypothetical protein
MPLILAAIRTGHDPAGKLPVAAFHTQLDEQVTCPKCSATYNLVCDFDASIGRHFPEESRRLIMMLRKAVMLGHFNGHRVIHFETNGVVVTRFNSSGEQVELNPKPERPAETALEKPRRDWSAPRRLN